MRTLSLCLLVALLSAGFAAPAASQGVITTITPDNGTTGEILVLAGGPFGKKKPRAEFIDEEGKKVKGSSLKVIAHSEVHVAVRVRKAVAGSFAIRVRPKLKSIPPLSSLDEFEVAEPVLFSIETGEATPGAELSFGVLSLGDRKPKMFVGGRRAKVTSFGPAFEGSLLVSVEFKLPKKLADGYWPLKIVTKVGSDELPQAVQVTGSKAKKIGKPQLLATVLGVPLKAKGKKLSVARVGETLVVSAIAKKKKLVRRIVLTFPEAALLDEVPLSVNGFTDGASLVYSEYTLAADPPFVRSWGGISWEFDIGSIFGGQIAGCFEGELQPLNPGSEGVRNPRGSVVFSVPEAD